MVAEPSRLTGSALGALVRSLALWIGIGTIGAVGMVVTASAIGAVPRPRGNQWWFTVPVGTGIGSHLGFYASVGLLVGGWAGVGYHAYRGSLSVRMSWLILALWGIPFFLGEPLFSRDLYSYIAQGQLARSGLNPYVDAPSALGPGNVLWSVAKVWRHTASPYGPLFVSLSHVAVTVAGWSMVVQILVFRALELMGVALMMVSLPVLARRLGNDPGLALWLAVLSPLALFSCITSGHNDALMIGLMLAGVALGTGGWFRWGIALCALGATIKLPAAAGIVFLVADACTRLDGIRRVRMVAESALITVLVMVGVTYGSGFGWTWLGPTALKVPTQLRVLIAPLVSVGSSVYGILHAAGLAVSKSTTISVVQTLGALVAIGVIVWMVFHIRGQGAVRPLGVALLLFVLLSPTVWPWYLLWGLAVLAATSAQRSRALAVVAALGMLVVGAGGTPMVIGGDYWVITVLLLAGLIWFIAGGYWRTAIEGPVHAS